MQGLYSKRELFQFRLSTDLKDSVICVTESWLNPDHTNSLLCNSADFQVFRADRDFSKVRKKSGGGLLILVPSFLNAKLVCDPHCEDGFESLCVDLFLRSAVRRQTVRICLIYRSPEHFDKQKGQIFCSHVDSLISPRLPTLLLGDINMPNVQWSRNAIVGRGPDALESQFFQLTLERGLSQLVTEPTRGDNILDLVFTSQSNLVHQVSVAEPFGDSDHNAVKFSFSKCAKRSTKNSSRFNFRKANYAAIAQALDRIDWPTVFQTCSTVQQMWDAFLSILKPLIEQFVPKCRSAPKKQSYKLR